MKKLISLVMLLNFSAFADECRLERTILRGVFQTYCPDNAYVVASRTDHIGNFTYTYLRCERIELVCDKDEEKKESDE